MCGNPSVGKSENIRIEWKRERQGKKTKNSFKRTVEKGSTIRKETQREKHNKIR